jgi:hypothetical protein
MNKKKQQPVKRKYVKKATKRQTVRNIDSTDVQFLHPGSKERVKDNEIELLAAIISIFDNWDTEQRSRNLKYIASRYYDFL